jgi:hypothetical protein
MKLENSKENEKNHRDKPYVILLDSYAFTVTNWLTMIAAL